MSHKIPGNQKPKEVFILLTGSLWMSVRCLREREGARNSKKGMNERGTLSITDSISLLVLGLLCLFISSGFNFYKPYFSKSLSGSYRFSNSLIFLCQKIRWPDKKELEQGKYTWLIKIASRKIP